MEGPEIYTITSYVQRNYVGHKFLSYQTIKNEIPYKLNRFDKKLGEDFEYRGKYIIDVRSKGKHLFIHLENNYVIQIHFGLFGYLTSKRDDKFLRYGLFTTFPIPFYYTDRTNYGFINFITYAEYMDVLNRLGKLDPYDLNTLTIGNIKEVYDKFQLKTIGALLLDQKYICGVGNYVRSEILYLAKIHPLTLVGKIDFDTFYNFMEQLYFYMSNIASRNCGSLLDICIRKNLFNFSIKEHYVDYYRTPHHRKRQNKHYYGLFNTIDLEWKNLAKMHLNIHSLSTTKKGNTITKVRIDGRSVFIDANIQKIL